MTTDVFEVSGTIDGVPITGSLSFTMEDVPTPPPPPPPAYSESTPDPTIHDFAASGHTFVCRMFAIDNGETVNTLGLFSLNPREVTLKIVQRTAAGVYDIHLSEPFSHPGGGWADHVLAASFVVPAEGEFHAAARVTGTSDRVDGTAAYASGDVIGTGVAFNETGTKSFGLRVAT